MALSDFGKAFRAARKAGKKTFTWKGKAYTTELRDEKKSKVPVPEPRPDRSGETNPATVAKASTPKIPVPQKRPTDDAGKANVEQANASTRASVDSYNERVREAKERHRKRMEEMERKRKGSGS